MVAFSVVFVLMDVQLYGLMCLVVPECVGRKRTGEDSGFLAISVRFASCIEPVVIGKKYFVLVFRRLLAFVIQNAARHTLLQLLEDLRLVGKKFVLPGVKH